MHGAIVEVEPFQMHGQQVGEFRELQTFVSVAFFIASFAEILVVPVQSFRPHEGAQCLILGKDGVRNTIVETTQSPRKHIALEWQHRLSQRF